MFTKPTKKQHLRNICIYNELLSYIPKDICKIVHLYERSDYIHTKYHKKAILRLFQFNDWETKMHMLTVQDVNTLLIRFVDIWISMEKYHIPANKCVISVLFAAGSDIFDNLIPVYFRHKLDVVNHISKIVEIRKINSLECVSQPSNFIKSIECRYYIGFLAVQTLLEPICFDFVDLLNLSVPAH
jgi:hypothetical protein